MALWTKGISKLKEVINEDGVLIKCPMKEGTFTIPDNMTAVARNAFEGCENVRINYSPKDIMINLSNILENMIESLNEDLSSNEEVGEENVILVFDVESELIDKSIENLLFWQEMLGEEKLKILEIEAGEILKICKQIESKDYKIQQEGSGILLIKNLTKEIYDALPQNFIYNLLREHSFATEVLSPKWIVMVNISKGLKLEPSEYVGKCFQGAYFKDIPVNRYMIEMDLKNKVVEPNDKEINEPETKSTKDSEINTQTIVQRNVKEIDWEERHFQICLALISRADLTSYHNNTVSSREIYPAKIIIKADEMIEALKKHHEEQNVS